MLEKGIRYKEISRERARAIYANLSIQCLGHKKAKKALNWSWEHYKKSDARYDGATFVREHNFEFWEVAAFIHDWLNANGYVGRAVDLFFIEVMIALNYPAKEVRRRIILMQFTFINVLWHKVRGTFKSDSIPI
jgi:hypothetical protein